MEERSRGVKRWRDFIMRLRCGSLLGRVLECLFCGRG